MQAGEFIKMIRTTCLGCGKETKNCACSTTLDHWESITGDTEVEFMIDDELTEIIKAIRNRCDVVLTLIEHYGTEHLIPTVLEDLYTDAQTIVDNYCVKDD